RCSWERGPGAPHPAPGVGGPSAEVVEEDILFVYAQVIQHLHAGLEHERWTAEVVLTLLRRRMVLEVLLIEDLVDEALEPRPVVLRQGIAEGQVPLEVVVLLLNGVEVL